MYSIAALKNKLSKFTNYESETVLFSFGLLMSLAYFWQLVLTSRESHKLGAAQHQTSDPAALHTVTDPDCSMKRCSFGINE